MSNTLIALDSDLAGSLLSALEESRMELKRLREQQTGQEPMTITESAKYLKVARSTVCEYLKSGALTPSQYGNRVWLTRKELDAFIERNRRNRRSL